MQTYTDYELILTNDGSTDESGMICDAYALNYPFIKVFHKEHEGSLLTRRFLLGQASGEYLLALDSDDFWVQGLLDMAHQTIMEYNADMVLFAFDKIDALGKVRFTSAGLFEDKIVFTQGNKGPLYAEMAKGSWLNSLCTKVIKRQIVDFHADYRVFGRLLLGEDLLQSLPLFANAKKIVYRNVSCYRYRDNAKGVCENFRPHYILDIDAVRQTLFRHLRNEGYDTEKNIDGFFTQYLLLMCKQINRITHMKATHGVKKEWLQRVRDLALFQRAVLMGCNRRLSRPDRFYLFLFRKLSNGAFLHLENIRKGGRAILPPVKAEASRANWDEKAVF